MNHKKYTTIGNITTIVNTVIVVAAGYLFGVLTAFFGSLPFSEAQLAGFLTAIVFLIFGYINAKNHNSFFDKDKDEINIPVDLNKEQRDSIQELIDYYQANNTINVEKSEDSENNDETIEEIDPSLEYENDGC